MVSKQMLELANFLRNMPRAEILLHLGEMTAQELRTARATLEWAAHLIDSKHRGEPTEEELEEAHQTSRAAVRSLMNRLRTGPIRHPTTGGEE